MTAECVKSAIFAYVVQLCRKRCITRPQLLLFANRKSHGVFLYILKRYKYQRMPKAVCIGTEYTLPSGVESGERTLEKSVFHCIVHSTPHSTPSNHPEEYPDVHLRNAMGKKWGYRPPSPPLCDALSVSRCTAISIYVSKQVGLCKQILKHAVCRPIGKSQVVQ